MYDTDMISDLSDVDLSRWIAEKLEPKENWNIYDGAESPLRLWNSRGLVIPDMDQSFQPRDMVNDPAMTVMLLEKMAYPNSTLTEYSEWAKTFERVLNRIHSSRRTTKTGLGRAVAEAWALANEWEK